MSTRSSRSWASVPLVVLGALLALLTLTTTVSAASVVPTVIPGGTNTDKTCAAVFPGTIELKFDPAVTGTKAPSEADRSRSSGQARSPRRIRTASTGAPSV